MIRTIPSIGRDSSDRDIERLIDRARIARADFIHHNPASALKTLGWHALACCAVLVIAIGAGAGRQPALENTAVMERLTTMLTEADTVNPGTLREIARLVQRRDYDCRQIDCDARLERRNAAARAGLETILAKRSSAASKAAAEN